MHTQNVNVRTAAQESSRKMGENDFMVLSVDQIFALFSQVIVASENELQPSIFSAPAGSVEVSVFDEYAPDYFSVWFIDVTPVAAGVPTEHYFRVLTSRINSLSGEIKNG